MNKASGYPQARPGHLQTDQGRLPRLKRIAVPFQSLCFTQRPVIDQIFRNRQQIIPASQARAIFKNERLSAEIKMQPHYLSQLFWSSGPSKMQSFSNNRCTFLPPINQVQSSINNQNTDTKYVCTLRDSRNEWGCRLCIEPANRFSIKPVNQFAYALVESNDDVMTGKIQRQKIQRGPVWLTG